MKLCRPIMILWVMGALFIALDLEASSTTNEISYAHEQLSANVVEAAIGEVLLAVAKEAKVAFSLNEAVATKKLSVRFDKLPLEEGIKKIIHSCSYSMVFGPSGQFEKVIIFKSGLRSAEEPISEAQRSKLDQAFSQGDHKLSPGPGGGPDEGVPPSTPVPEVFEKEMEGDHENQYTAGEEESDMGEAPKHPAGDTALPPGTKVLNPSAEGP